MDNLFKNVFVMICTTVVVFIVWALLDLAFASILTLVIQIWNPILAVKVFRCTFIILFSIEFILTIPAMWKTMKENKGVK